MLYQLICWKFLFYYDRSLDDGLTRRNSKETENSKIRHFHDIIDGYFKWLSTKHQEEGRSPDYYCIQQSKSSRIIVIRLNYKGNIPQAVLVVSMQLWISLRWPISSFVSKNQFSVPSRPTQLSVKCSPIFSSKPYKKKLDLWNGNISMFTFLYWNNSIQQNGGKHRVYLLSSILSLSSLLISELMTYLTCFWN